MNQVSPYYWAATMDYLDSHKATRRSIMLFSGYILWAIAIALTTLILVYQAYGFGLGKNGSVIQNGLIFFSSQPNPANIYINNSLSSQTTNTRLIIPSGIYQIKLTRSGYRDWNRRITVIGGNVEHFDYPLLIPNKLTSSKIVSYSSAPGLVSQSLDRNWLLIQQPGSAANFDLYNLSTPAKPVITTVSIPSSIINTTSGGDSWAAVAWADDNTHVLLKHSFSGGSEYVLLDITNPSQSVNLNSTMSINGGVVSFNNEKYNQFYIYDATNDDLYSTQLGSTSNTLVEDHVLAFKTYLSNSVLYVTGKNAPSGKVYVKLLDGSNDYTIRELPVSSQYLVNIAGYNGTLYAAIGSNSDNRVYIYQNPIGQISSNPGSFPVPVWVLHVNGVNNLSFSDNAQFIMAENANNYAVYDLENQVGFLYSNPKLPLDSPQTNVSWMDGDRTIYVSGGKIIMADYDNSNIQSLIPADPAYIPAFSNNYDYMYSVDQSTTSPGSYDLLQTPLLTPSDL